jgi:hypothetical protein
MFGILDSAEKVRLHPIAVFSASQSDPQGSLYAASKRPPVIKWAGSAPGARDDHAELAVDTVDQNY